MEPCLCCYLSFDKILLSRENRLEDRFADATVWCLDMKQGANGGGDVGHVARFGAGSLLDAPTHEYQWDVGVVAIPSAMRGAFHAVVVEVWLQDYLYATATLTVETIDDAILHFLWDALDGSLLHIASIEHVLVFLQSVYYHLLHL